MCDADVYLFCSKLCCDNKLCFVHPIPVTITQKRKRKKKKFPNQYKQTTKHFEIIHISESTLHTRQKVLRRLLAAVMVTGVLNVWLCTSAIWLLSLFSSTFLACLYYSISKKVCTSVSTTSRLRQRCAFQIIINFIWKELAVDVCQHIRLCLYIRMSYF